MLWVKSLKILFVRSNSYENSCNKKKTPTSIWIFFWIFGIPSCLPAESDEILNVDLSPGYLDTSSKYPAGGSRERHHGGFTHISCMYTLEMLLDVATGDKRREVYTYSGVAASFWHLICTKRQTRDMGRRMSNWCMIYGSLQNRSSLLQGRKLFFTSTRAYSSTPPFFPAKFFSSPTFPLFVNASIISKFWRGPVQVIHQF